MINTIVNNLATQYQTIQPQLDMYAHKLHQAIQYSPAPAETMQNIDATTLMTGLLGLGGFAATATAIYVLGRKGKYDPDRRLD